MAVSKEIIIDGKKVKFKASATVPRLYRAKFRRDIFEDINNLSVEVSENDEKNSKIDFEMLEVFENIAYIMARHADSENVPDTPDDWLEQFNTFSIYEVLPQLLDLWGMNMETKIDSKKKLNRLTAK